MAPESFGASSRRIHFHGHFRLKGAISTEDMPPQEPINAGMSPRHLVAISFVDLTSLDIAESFSSNTHTILTSGPQRFPRFPLSFWVSPFPFTVPFVPLPLFFPPWPSISRCPALAPSIFSVCAVKPPLSFFVIFCALIRLSFLGATVRPPFLVMPAREEWEDLAVVDLGLDLVLIVPCAIATVENTVVKLRV